MSNTNPKRSRPVFRNLGLLDLLRYRLPWPGKVSILHRISGFGLFLLLWFLLFLLDTSLFSQYGFELVSDVMNVGVIKFTLCALLWAYLYHFCAGIRFLLLDLHVGVDKHVAQKSAWVTILASFVLTATVCMILSS